MVQNSPGLLLRSSLFLVLVPVLSFYLFSFESIRDNLKKAESQFDEFNLKVGGEVDELYYEIQITLPLSITKTAPEISVKLVELF